jgi:hypothetical protein
MGNYNSSTVNINPLLITVSADQINIQPYWIVVVELIALQLTQRIWHHFKYKTWFTTLEIAGLMHVFKNDPGDLNDPESKTNKNNYFTKKSNGKGKLTPHQNRLLVLRSMIAIDFFDAINCIILIAQAIWYCIIQSSCQNLSSPTATPWNCYNVFGYRLYNYIFVSYSTTTLNIVYKTYMQGFWKVINTDHKKGSCDWIMHYITLIIIVVTLFFDTCLLFPFILTHVIPMFVIYIWMSIIYISVCIYFIASGFLAYEEIEDMPEKFHPKEIRHKPRQYETQCCSFMFRPKELPQVAISMILALLITTFPILLSIFYNYTQYFYYGETYINSINDDYNARDTNRYFSIIQNSTQQILHSAANFL